MTPCPLKINMWSTTLFKKNRSWEIMIKQPLNSFKKFSNTCKVGISKSLVGSSKIKKLGFLNKIVNNNSRFFSPPLKESK